MALMCQDGFEMNYKLSYKHIFYAVGRIMSSHISLDFNICLFSILLTQMHDGMLKTFITFHVFSWLWKLFAISCVSKCFKMFTICWTEMSSWIIYEWTITNMVAWKIIPLFKLKPFWFDPERKAWQIKNCTNLKI